MDRVDRQIIHCLQRNGRVSFQRMARVIGVSEQTVSRRFRALSGRGALRVLAVPDPRHTGCRTWILRIVCRPEATHRLATALAERNDVSWVSITGAGSELTCVNRADPLSPDPVLLLHGLPRSRDVVSFHGYAMLHMHLGGEAEWSAFDDPLTDEQVTLLQDGTHRQYPDESRTRVGLRLDDAPLLAELARDGRTGVAALTRATGWPVSRVSARLDELLGTGTLHTEVDLAPRLFGFDAAAYLWVTVAPRDLARTGRALSLHPETGFTAAVTGSANLLLAVNCRDVDALYDYVTTRVGGLPEVRSAEVVPILRRIKQAGTRVGGASGSDEPGERGAPV